MKINIFGVPSNAGALYLGTEKTPQVLREAGLVNRLGELGFEVKDRGDILNCAELPRHNIAPVRNWPAPRIVWERLQVMAEEIFSNDCFTVLLGGDCSVEVGSFNAFRKLFGKRTHLLVLDGHLDTMTPKGDKCIGAAGMGLWFLVKDNFTWWNEENISPSCISVIGVQAVPENCDGIKVVSLKEMQESDELEIIRQHLLSIPSEDSILVHFDVDMLSEDIMPAAYSPSKEGLNYNKAKQLFNIILTDKRVRGIEITEFCADKDVNGISSALILELISEIKNRKV